MKLFPKALLCTLAALFCFISSFSQNKNFENADAPKRLFKPFKWEISAGYALPIGGGSVLPTKMGGLLAMEPHYAINDRVSLGLRFEVAGLARVIKDVNNDISGDVNANVSTMLTGDYYFTSNRFRPFVGAGAGIATVAKTSFTSDTDPEFENIPTENKIGFLVRGGFEAGHFRLGIEYNIVGATANSTYNSYLGAKIGICIGGGRIKNRD